MKCDNAVGNFKMKWIHSQEINAMPIQQIRWFNITLTQIQGIWDAKCSTSKYPNPFGNRMNVMGSFNRALEIHFVHKSMSSMHHLKYLYLDNVIHIGTHILFSFFLCIEVNLLHSCSFRIIWIDISSNLRHCIFHLKIIDFDSVLVSRILEHIQSVPFNCAPIHSQIFKSKYVLMSPMWTWMWTFLFNDNAKIIPPKWKKKWMDECLPAMDRISVSRVSE